jgi:hypothetical protein
MMPPTEAVYCLPSIRSASAIRATEVAILLGVADDEAFLAELHILVPSTDQGGGKRR